jgi:hypothetical protein
VSVNNGAHVVTRDTDSADNQTVVAVGKRVGNCEMGVLANYDNTSPTYYLWWLVQNSATLYRSAGGGFTSLGSYAFTFSNDTYFRFGITTQTDGSNKIVTGWLDDGGTYTARVGPVTTSTLYTNGLAGIRAFPYSGPGTGSFDWWAFNTVPSISTLDPSSGPPGGGTAVSVVGADFGDSAAVTFTGAGAGTSYTFIDATHFNITSPAGSSGLVAPVTYFFGEAQGAFVYQGGGADFTYHTNTFTASPTHTSTPTISATFTDTPTPTISATFTPTHTPTISATDTGTFTITQTSTFTPTFTRTHTMTFTLTPTPVGTAIPLLGIETSLGFDQVFRMNSDGTSKTIITTDNFDKRNPIWIDGGSRIMYGSQIDGTWSILSCWPDNTGCVTVGSSSSFDEWPGAPWP